MELELCDGLLVGLLRIVGLLILRARWGAGGEGEVAPTAAQKPLSVGLGSVWMGLTRSRGHHRSHATKERGCGRGRRATGRILTRSCACRWVLLSAHPCASEIDAQSNMCLAPRPSLRADPIDESQGHKRAMQHPCQTEREALGAR